MVNKSKFATIVLSIVPGLGHLYLGFQERGLQFMLAFFLSIFLIDWLQLSLFAFLLPVIWFYSLFDALQCLSQGEPPQVLRSPWIWILDKQRWVGIGLIVLGGLILFNRMVIPWLEIYLTYRTLRMISASLMALLFIAGGIRLALGKPLPAPRENGMQAERVSRKGDEE